MTWLKMKLGQFSIFIPNAIERRVIFTIYCEDKYIGQILIRHLFLHGYLFH